MTLLRDILTSNNGSNFYTTQLRGLINGDNLSDRFYAVVLTVQTATVFENAAVESAEDNILYDITARTIGPFSGQSSRQFSEHTENPCLIPNSPENDAKKRMLTGLQTKFTGVLPFKDLKEDDVVLVQFKHHIDKGQKYYDLQRGILLKKVNTDVVGVQGAGASAQNTCADGSASLLFGSGSPMSVVPPPAVTPPTLSSFLSSAEYETTGGPVIEQAKKLKFETFDTEPFRMFIFGIRGPSRTVDSFDDTLGVAYIDRGGKWHLHYYIGTTDPGAYYTTRTKHGKGVATSIMAKGQYIDAYEIGPHYGYQALVQKGQIRQYLDSSGDARLDFDGSPHTTKPGSPGLNIHASVRTPGQTATRVGSYGAGCQVHATADGFESMMTLARLQVAEIGKRKFTYTLMDQWWPGGAS